MELCIEIGRNVVYIYNIELRFVAETAEVLDPEMVFSQEKLPNLPGFAKQIIRPRWPERDIPFHLVPDSEQLDSPLLYLFMD